MYVAGVTVVTGMSHYKNLRQVLHVIVSMRFIKAFKLIAFPN